MRSTRAPARAGLLIVALVFAGGPVGTADAGDGSLLVFGPGSSNADGVIASGYVRERLPARERPKDRVGVTGIPFPADRTLWITGDADAVWCDGGSAPEPLPAVVGRAREATDLLETTKVIEIVDRYERSLACVQEWIDGALLGELYLLRGLASHVDGDEGAASADFARAAGIHPELRWDVGYPPGPQQAYLLAKEAVGDAQPAMIGHGLAGEGVAEVRVDGRPLQGFALHALPPVPHVLQVHTADGIVSALLRPDEGQRAVVVDRVGLSTAVMRAPQDELAATVARDALAALAAQWGVARVVVVDTTYRKELGEPFVYAYGIAERTFEPLSANRVLRRHIPRYADRVRIAVGAGLAADTGPAVREGETDVSAESHLAIYPGGSLEVRIGSGFTPNGSLDIVIHRAGEDSELVVTPEVRGGFGYRWHPRFVQTYVGLSLHGRFNARELGSVTGRYVFQPDGSAADVDGALGIDINIDLVTPRLPLLFARVGGGAAIFASGTRVWRAAIWLGLRI